MNLLELVKARYSCRNYQPTSVEQEKLDYVMECVRFAPSAVNKQPWLFHIIINDGFSAPDHEDFWSNFDNLQKAKIIR